MKRKIFTSVLMSVFYFTLFAQQTDYKNGTFILNEDWFGHNNSSINFISNTEEIFYRVYAEENKAEDFSLGCTSQYGTIYGGNLLIMSKQEKDNGDGRTGGRFIVADDANIKSLLRFDYIAQNASGKSLADGRACAGVYPNKVYLGTSNGIYTFNSDAGEIGNVINGTENPLITGNESNADGQGPLYNNQIGHIIRGAEYVFAVYQDSGVFIIDPQQDTVVKVIKGCYSSMEQSKDGSIWVVRNTNMAAQKYPYGGANYGSYGKGWKGNQLLKINQFSLDTSSVNIPNGTPGIRQTWYAWTDGGFCASAKSNTLYWTDDNGWFQSSKVYKYDIDNNSFSQIFDAKNIHSSRNIYGAGIGIDPKTDHLFVFLFNSFADNRNWIAKIDNNGNTIKNYELVQNYWFPAMPIFVDNHAPQFSSSSNIPTTVDIDRAEYRFYLGNVVTDEDNLNAAIVKSAKNIGNKNLVQITIKHDTLRIKRKSLKIGGSTTFDLLFNSNGKTISKKITINVSETILRLKKPIPDREISQNAEEQSIDLNKYFVAPSPIAFSLKENSNPSILNAYLSGSQLKIKPIKDAYGEAQLIVRAKEKTSEIFDTINVRIDAKPRVKKPLLITMAEDGADKTINLNNYFTDPDDETLEYKIKSNDNETLCNCTLDKDKLIIKLHKDQNGKANIAIKASASGQSVQDTLKLTVTAIDDPIFVKDSINDIFVMENAKDSTIDLSQVFFDPDNDNSQTIISLVSNSNQALVNATLNNKMLTLKFIKNKSGTATITIKGELNGKEANDSFLVTVKDVDQPLVLHKKIEDTTVLRNSETIVLNLKNTFTDPDDDDEQIEIQVSENSSPKLLEATVNKQTLLIKLKNNKYGKAKLVIRGSLNGYHATDTFYVNVVAPIYLAKPLQDIFVKKNDPINNIDLSQVFADPDDDINEATIKLIQNSKPELAEVSIVNNKTIKIQLQKNKVGETQIILQAELAGYKATDTFNIYVDDPVFVANPLSGIVVKMNAQEKRIDLSEVFSDPDEPDANKILLSIDNNTNKNLVKAEIKDKILQLQFTANKYGNAEIVIKASSNLSYAYDTLHIKVDYPIFVKNKIADITVDENAENKTISLKNVFADPDDDMKNIKYSILKNSNPDLVKTTLKDSAIVLEFIRNKSGKAQIVLQAMLNYEVARDTFLVTVKNKNAIVETTNHKLRIYPNPAYSIFTIEAKHPINTIEIIDLTGKVIRKAKSNNRIEKVNVNDLKKGVYLLKIKINQQVITKRLIKN